MGLIFKDDFQDEFGSWPIAYIPYGGADFGEILAVAQAVGDGDDAAFYDAWPRQAPRRPLRDGQSLAAEPQRARLARQRAGVRTALRP